MPTPLSDEYIEQHFRDESWRDPRNVAGADPASYCLLNHAWAVDRQHVYFEGNRIRNADRNSFVVLNELFARDAHTLYSKGGDVSAVVDPDTFSVLDKGEVSGIFGIIYYFGYARDSTNVYFADSYDAPRVLRGADAATFLSVGSRYGRDKDFAYHEGKRIKGSTASGFEVLNAHHARDSRSVFYLDRLIDGASVNDFSVIDEFMSRDNSRVYDRGQAQPGIDPASYQQLDGLYVARDRSHVYVANQRQDHIDMATFEFLGHDYFADKNGVYWQGRKIKGARRDSFVVEDYQKARDANRSYYKDGGNVSAEPIRSFRRLSSGRFMLLRIFFGAVFAVGGTMFHAWRHRRRVPDTVDHSPQPRPADMRVLAQTLACGNAEALAPVMLAIDDMPAFLQEYGTREACVGEPDYVELVLNQDDPEDLHPFQVLREVYGSHQLLGGIDWRSDTSETISQAGPMLVRHGIRDFDWSFVEVLEEHGDGTELQNQNFLSVLRDRLMQHGLTLVHVNVLSDSYAFAVLPLAEYAKIAGFSEDEMFNVSTEFGADDGYDKALSILARHLPEQ